MKISLSPLSISLHCSLLIEQFFDSFLFSFTSESRSSGTDANAHGSAYNASAIQFAPKHLGLVLVRTETSDSLLF